MNFNLIHLDINSNKIDFGNRKFKNSRIIAHYTNSAEIKKLNCIIEASNNDLNFISLYRWCNNYLQFIPVDFFEDHYINDKLYKYKDSLFQLRLKRILDILFSLFLLIISIPLILIALFLIFLEDQGSLFYIQLRTGKDEKPFYIFKLKT